MEKPPETKTKIGQTSLAWLLVALIALIVMRLLPLLKAPLSAFGYDYGFYLFAASHAAGLQLGTALWGGYNSPLFYLSQLLRIPPTIMVNELYLLAAIFLGLSWYWYFKNQSWKVGVWAALLSAFSIFQAEAFTMYLWKNIIALPFLLLGFKFLREKKYRPFAVCSLAILLTHRTTTIVYLLTVGAYFLYQQLRVKKFLWIFIEALLAATSLFLLWPKIYPLIQDLIDNNNYYVRTGLFLEGQNLLALLWPTLLLALLGIYLHIKRRHNPLPLIFLGICVVWVIFRLPFFHRFWIYVDLALIGFAAYFLGSLNYRSPWMKASAAIVILFLGYRAVVFVTDKTPLISSDEIAEIKNFNHPGFVLAVSANDAPWLLGYAHNVRLGAPGLLENPHTYQQWINFWYGKNQQAFLAAYPKPLYLYQRSYQISQGEIIGCLTQLSQNFYQDTCN